MFTHDKTLKKVKSVISDFSLRHAKLTTVTRSRQQKKLIYIILKDNNSQKSLVRILTNPESIYVYEARRRTPFIVISPQNPEINQSIDCRNYNHLQRSLNRMLNYLLKDKIIYEETT